MTQEELNKILDAHEMWMSTDGKQGARAVLNGENLDGLDLSNWILDYASLSGASLKYASLNGASLNGASLDGASLDGAINVPYIPMVCPEEGAFVGWKKVDNYIIQLEIPQDAKRSSATTRKCRCEYAKVLNILTLDGNNADVSEVVNTNYKPSVTYKIGEIVRPDAWDDDRWRECSHGIHFFINRREAVDYEL